MDIFEEIVNEQQAITFKSKRAFCNDREVPILEQNANAEDAIAAAKLRAGSRFIVKSNNPTSISELVISEGEGRATREMEFLWYPNLYKISPQGKLAIRFYISKTTICHN